MSSLQKRNGPFVLFRHSRKIFLFFLVGWIGTSFPLAAGLPLRLMADGHQNFMPVRWEDAFKEGMIILDRARLERGEILGRIEEKEDGSLSAQTVGLIKARPEECFRVITDYKNYRKIMPYTVESRILRSFLLEGDYEGFPAVDFWTRIRVFGFSTGYLIRIVHLPEPDKQRFRTFWTLVDHPERLAACRDENNRPCVNDLTVNLGAHLLEPFPGNPSYTLHTYTLTIAAEGWLRRSALQWDGAASMKEVTLAMRKVLEKRAPPASEKGDKSHGEK